MHQTRNGEQVRGGSTPILITQSQLMSPSCRQTAAQNKSLVPTFVFPVKRRGFEEAFVQSFLMLERLSLPDQETVVGLFRVNLTKIQGKYIPFSLPNDIG